MKTCLKYFIAVCILQNSLLIFTPVSAQVLCIYCYPQNERILVSSNNLILNGGFENGCTNGEAFCPVSQDYECDLSSWICSGGGPGTYAHVTSNLLVKEGNKAAYFGNGFSEVCSSVFDTLCLSQDMCDVTGIPTGYPVSYEEYGGESGVSLEQSVDGLIPGDIYELEFWAGGEDFPKMELADGVFAVDVGFGNIYLRDPATPPEDGIGIRYVVVFRASTSFTKIKFTNWGHIHFEATELILDDVRLMKSSEIDDPCTTSVGGIDIEEALDIFPNPFHTSAILDLSNIELKDGQLLLYNSNGLLVRSMRVEQSTITIERDKLPNGIFFFQLVSQKQVVQIGKFIIE